MHENELACHIALSQSLLSSGSLVRLVKACGSAQAAWGASQTLLKEHLTEKQVEKLSDAQNRLQPAKMLATFTQLGIQAVPIEDPAYPALLKFSHNPPFLLYIRGNTTILHQKTLAVVGTRRFTEYGSRVVDKLITEVASAQPCIVSGLAAGIDTLAHQAALKHALPTVAVFGTGIDQIYPRANEGLSQQILDSGGALMSEFPLGFPGEKYTFPLRNRIIAGMSEGTLVIEGSVKSGALITARVALDENRQVMAVPGNIFSPTAQGPNYLIQEGATPVDKGEDILHALGWETVSAASKAQSKQNADEDLSRYDQLSDREQHVLNVVGYEPTSFDEIQSQRQEVTVMDLQAVLTMLELQGFINALPGAKFCRI